MDNREEMRGKDRVKVKMAREEKRRGTGRKQTPERGMGCA